MFFWKSGTTAAVSLPWRGAIFRNCYCEKNDGVVVHVNSVQRTTPDFINSPRLPRRPRTGAAPRNDGLVNKIRPSKGEEPRWSHLPIYYPTIFFQMLFGFWGAGAGFFAGARRGAFCVVLRASVCSEFFFFTSVLGV